MKKTFIITHFGNKIIKIQIKKYACSMHIKKLAQK